MENITNEEKEIIREHILMFASNFLRCDIDKCDLCERYKRGDSLAGMELLRTENYLLLFRQFVDADFNWIPFMCRLSHWELKCKRRLLQGLSIGNTEMKCRNMLDIKTEVRANQRWWGNDYKENDDSIHLLIDEYNLADSYHPYPISYETPT
ncbi:hypothetical protein PRIPAC_70901, partial [Pristionchus pacificus]|uniref:Uncharacterized protein n=1 Tax=Pristionchus pacificus TaxID=54126 RepID=A0A2A6CRV8_PRIPA